MQTFSLYLLSTVFISAGSYHFINPAVYVSIMPDYLPWHLPLVYISGLFEIVGGIAILITRVRKLAGLGLILLAIAVFPANIQMALHPELYLTPDTYWLAYARLPLQFVIIVWIFWVTRPLFTKHR